MSNVPDYIKNQEFPTTKEERVRFSIDRFQELSPNARVKALLALRKLVRGWEGQGDWDTLVASIESGEWPPVFFHMSMSMSIRNYLRREGCGESELDVWSLDDYYMPLLEVALQQVYGFKFPWIEAILNE